MASYCNSTQQLDNFNGIGVGLRTPHFQQFLSEDVKTEYPNITWLEIAPENYLHHQGNTLDRIKSIRKKYPITFHAVSLSLGSTDPINKKLLEDFISLAGVLKPIYLSEHLCWSSIQGQYIPDLLPLPYTDSVIHHVADRIKLVQDIWGEKILLENVSSYLNFTDSHMSEWEFFTRVVEEADCYILLDINNVFVSASNHRFSAETYLRALPTHRVKEIHLAGYSEKSGYLLDTHSQPVFPPVWELYELAMNLVGPIPTLIEWDNDIPSLDTLYLEVNKAKKIMDEVNHDKTYVA